MKRYWLFGMLAACGGATRAGSRGQLQQVDFDATAPIAVSPDVTNGGVWFDDASCRDQFLEIGPVPPGQQAAFAVCLDGLHLHQSTRQSGLRDQVLLETDSGMELEAALETSPPHRIRHIEFVDRILVGDANPTVTPGALESLAIDPAPSAGDEWLWAKVCIDATGATTRVDPLRGSSVAAYQSLGEPLAHRAFRPFLLGGEPTPVCTVEVFGAPPDDERTQVPPRFPTTTPDADKIVPRTTFGTMVSGDLDIYPSDRDKTAIGRANIGQISTFVKYCVNTDGATSGIALASSSGFPAYDALIVERIGAWRYPPQAVRACTTLEIVYSQR